MVSEKSAFHTCSQQMTIFQGSNFPCFPSHVGVSLPLYVMFSQSSLAGRVVECLAWQASFAMERRADTGAPRSNVAFGWGFGHESTNERSNGDTVASMNSPPVFHDGSHFLSSLAAAPIIKQAATYGNEGVCLLVVLIHTTPLQDLYASACDDARLRGVLWAPHRPRKPPAPVGPFQDLPLARRLDVCWTVAPGVLGRRADLVWCGLLVEILSEPHEQLHLT